MTLSKILNFSWQNYKTYLIEFLWGLNETVYKKFSLAYNKFSISEMADYNIFPDWNTPSYLRISFCRAHCLSLLYHHSIYSWNELRELSIVKCSISHFPIIISVAALIYIWYAIKLKCSKMYKLDQNKKEREAFTHY